MSEESVDKSKESSVTQPKKNRIFMLAKRFFEGVTWLSEKAMSFLRLFAVTILFIIVVTLVYRAIKNADIVVVKPFSVPKTLSDSNSQAGRIAANFLRQDLKRKEQQFNASMQGQIRDSNIASASDQQLDSGANIKLPQTGISINDVVEFISTLFGKQSISGTVYEDRNALYLQLELRGRVLSFEQPLVEGVSKIKQLEELLNKQSSKKILSVAFENYNLYYYCNGEVLDREQHTKKYRKWFEYCQNFRMLKDEQSILDLKAKVGTSKNKKLARQDRLIAHVLTSLKHKLQDKEDLLARAKQKKTDKEQANKEQRSSSVSPVVLLPSVELALVLETGASVLEGQKKAGNQLVAEMRKNRWEPVDVVESEKKVADASLLYQLNLYEDAIVKYKAAIIANNQNATAWANLGLLYAMAGVAKYQDFGKAWALLNQAISIEPKWGWLHHGLCITQAYSRESYQKTQPVLDKFLSSNASCQRARSLEPSKSVLYDKLFYIAMADKLYEKNLFIQAYKTYQRCITIDQRADCYMYDVISKLRKLDDDKRVTGAKEYACTVLTEKAYFIEKQPSECDADLRLLQEECNR